MAALPFQFLYHFTNGISFLAGVAITFRENNGRLLRRGVPAPTVANPETAVESLERPALSRRLGID